MRRRSWRWPAALAWGLAGLAVLSGVPAFWLLSRTWLADVEGARPTLATVGPVVLAVASAAAVGALVASRRPAPPGRLAAPRGRPLGVLQRAGRAVREVRAGGAAGVAAGRLYLVPFLYSSFLVALACAGFVLLLTPTGSLPSPRWRWWARVAAVAPAVTVLGFAVQPDPLAPDYLGNPLAVPALAPALLVAALAGMAVTAAGLLVGAGSLVAPLPPGPGDRAPPAPLAGPGRGVRVGAAAGRPGGRGPGP